MDELRYLTGGIPVIINTTDSQQTTNGDTAHKHSTEEQSISVFIIDNLHSKLKRILIRQGSDLEIPIALEY